MQNDECGMQNLESGWFVICGDVEDDGGGGGCPFELVYDGKLSEGGYKVVVKVGAVWGAFAVGDAPHKCFGWALAGF